MSADIDSLIRDVSDTALWVATYRAMESERPDALFRDPFARRLAGERGAAIVRAMPHGARMAWPMIVRTRVIDEIVTRLVNEQGADAVLNLAAGLDARPWRLALPETLHWYDVDLPAMLEYKRAGIGDARPACRYEALKADLADANARHRLVAAVAATHRNVVVLSEGLLIYLEPADVAGLARDLAAPPSLRTWIADLGSPRMLKMVRNTWAARLRRVGAPFRFTPEEGTRFFEPHGWREAEYRSIWTESLRLGRGVPFAGFWDLLMRLPPRTRRESVVRMSGVVRFERTSVPPAGPAGEPLPA